MLKSKLSTTMLGMAALLLSLSVTGCSSRSAPEPAAASPEDVTEEVVEVDPVEAPQSGPVGEVPQEAVDALSHEIDLITLDWAPGSGKPGLGEVMPWLIDADIRGFNKNGQFIFVSPWMDEGQGAITEGDVAVAAGFHWQCGWLEEYFRAVDAGDTPAADRAAEMLGQLRNLESVTRYSGDFAHAYESAFAPAFEGDDANARSMLKVCHEMVF